MNRTAKTPRSSAQRVANYRQRMRDAGLVQRVVWVHDTRSAEYLAEARRQSLVIANDPRDEAEIMTWLDQVRAQPDD